MLELLGTLFGSVVSGGATGLLGVALQRFADYKNRQLELELEDKRAAIAIALKKADAEIMAQEWAARTRVAEIEADGASDVAASQAFAASYGTEPERYATGKLSYGQRWVMVALDALRGIVRPGLTIYLCAITTMIWMQASALLLQYGASALPVDAASKLVMTIVATILYLTTTCVLWWFGTRNKAPQPGVK